MSIERSFPRVSVLMTAYNEEKFIKEAVESILRQTYTNFEFIIVDDGSIDRSREILANITDNRIVYLRNEKNLGLIQSLNRGLAAARGEYIARMDANDISLPERLARQVSYLDAHPDVGVLGNSIYLMNEYGEIKSTRFYSGDHIFLCWSLLFYSPICHSTVMMRKYLLQNVGGYKLDFLHAEDYELWVRLSHLTHLGNLQDVLICVRELEIGISTKFRAIQIENSIRVSKREISRILMGDVPLVRIQNLWGAKFNCQGEITQVVILIYNLYKAYTMNPNLSLFDKRLIRKDAAKRIFELSRCSNRSLGMWKILGMACWLDPVLSVRIVKGLLNRLG